MSVLQTLNPAYGKGITGSVTGTSAASEIGFGHKTLCLTNLGAETVYVRVGLSGVVATTSDYPVLSGTQVTITKDQDHTHIAYKTGTASSLHIIPGEGF